MDVASPRRKRRETLELFPRGKNSTVDSNFKVCAQQLKSKHKTKEKARAWKSDGSRFESFILRAGSDQGKPPLFSESQFPYL